LPKIKFPSIRVLALCSPVLLAACVAKVAPDQSGSYFKLTNIGKNGDVCQVLTDGSGTPVKIRGSIFSKGDNGCTAAQAYTQGKIVGANIMEVTSSRAKVGWKNSGYMDIQVTKYGNRRHIWVPATKGG